MGGSFGRIAWAVPAVVFGVPGLLLLIALVAQAVGGLAMVPVVRRWNRRPGPGPGHLQV